MTPTSPGPRFTACDPAAFDALFAALEDARTRAEDYPDDYPEFETYFSDTEDCIDGNGSEVVNALLAPLGVSRSNASGNR